MTVFWKRLVILVILLSAVSLLIFKKWDWLLYGLILLCPLMHLFGHGHSGNGSSSHAHDHER
ncbi:hypothetical protein CULT_580025 [[Clostridium] ultunense Esp]|nr:hypothetical protein CULT_580025 [[Clostridium] ultunense Esp]